MQSPLPTQQEEQEAREFLERAEIRTMRKDLAALRETDALQERDKIVNIQPPATPVPPPTTPQPAPQQPRAISEQGDQREAAAMQNVKQYANEAERQQIFLLESQRLSLTKQLQELDQKTEPGQQLQKNERLIKLREAQQTLNTIAEQERQKEQEQAVLGERARTTTIPSERQSLEQHMHELDNEIQAIEKKRWAAEKQLQDLQTQAISAETGLGQLTEQRNTLHASIKDIDMQLRGIYSGVIQRENLRRQGQLQSQQEKAAQVSQIRSKEREQVRREQHQQVSPSAAPVAPQSFRERLAQSAAKEEEARRKFLAEVKQAAETGGNQQMGKSKID